MEDEQVRGDNLHDPRSFLRGCWGGMNRGQKNVGVYEREKIDGKILKKSENRGIGRKPAGDREKACPEKERLRG